MSPAGRAWTARRGSVTCLAALAVVATAVGLSLQVWPDAAGLSGEGRVVEWRQWTVDRLALPTEPGFWLALGAAVAASGGLCCLILAATPGRRWLLMTNQNDGFYAELDRRGAALLLRDVALAVPGVSSVTVRAVRGGFRVRASAAFGDLERVDAQLAADLEAAADVLGTRRRPRFVVRLRPTGEWTPPPAPRPSPAPALPHSPVVIRPSPESPTHMAPARSDGG